MQQRSVRTLLAGVLALVMALGLSVAASAEEFADTKGHWGESSINRWSEYGVMTADESGNFQPDKEMTRAEFAKMLVSLMGYTEEAENTFTDLPEGADADAILMLIQAGVMNGNGDGTVAPNEPVSYEQAAVMLCRALGIRTAAGTTEAAVAALAERGMTDGIGGEGFVAAGHVNRAGMAKLLDNMVSNYVTEDGATVTGEVKGVVIVKAKNVKIENATLAAPVVVAPAAAEATVSLTGTTSASDVVVAAKGAKVVVAETASAKAVEVEAPDAGAEIAGKVESVAVSEKAAGASVTVDKGGSVDKVATSAPNAKVDVAGTVKDVTVSGSETDVKVSGTVEKVDVAESAAGTDVKTEAGAKVDNVTSAAKDVTVSGEAGTVGSVTATGESDVKADVAGAEVKNEGTGNVTANGESVASGETATAPEAPAAPETPTPPVPTPTTPNRDDDEEEDRTPSGGSSEGDGFVITLGMVTDTGHIVQVELVPNGPDKYIIKMSSDNALTEGQIAGKVGADGTWAGVVIKFPNDWKIVNGTKNSTSLIKGGSNETATDSGDLYSGTEGNLKLFEMFFNVKLDKNDLVLNFVKDGDETQKHDVTFDIDVNEIEGLSAAELSMLMAMFGIEIPQAPNTEAGGVTEDETLIPEETQTPDDEDETPAVTTPDEDEGDECVHDFVDGFCTECGEPEDEDETTPGEDETTPGEDEDDVDEDEDDVDEDEDDADEDEDDVDEDEDDGDNDDDTDGDDVDDEDESGDDESGDDDTDVEE